MYKKIIACISIFVLITCAFSAINIVKCEKKVGEGFDESLIPSTSTAGGAYNYLNDAKKPLKNIYSTVIVICQIASVAGVVIAGIVYMFSDAGKKADIKKSLIHLVIGLVIVFTASTIISLVTGTFNQLTGN